MACVRARVRLALSRIGDGVQLGEFEQTLLAELAAQPALTKAENGGSIVLSDGGCVVHTGRASAQAGRNDCARQAARQGLPCTPPRRARRSFVGTCAQSSTITPS